MTPTLFDEHQAPLSLEAFAVRYYGPSLVCYSISSERDLLTLLIDVDILWLFLICPAPPCLTDHKPRIGGEELFSGVPPSRGFPRSLSGLWASLVCYSISSERDLLTLLIDVDILWLFLICPAPPCLTDHKPWIGEELFSGVPVLRISVDHKPWIGGEELFSGVPRLKNFSRFTTCIAGCDLLDNIKKPCRDLVNISTLLMTPTLLANFKIPCCLRRSLSGLWASLVCYSISSERDLLTLLIDVDILRLFLICPAPPCLTDQKPWMGERMVFRRDSSQEFP
ncbi:hypothetical protein CEXT_242561 [Caerostris extrusa]|uniref:Uncharacterized protein n=1 Tax=Caerostris extrusa TaxID=172846 RepID=A0AAV4XQW6_CAEEX|nr:hypothetical protein CEXT_242561 [Caerostris extrusa]